MRNRVGSERSSGDEQFRKHSGQSLTVNLNENADACLTWRHCDTVERAPVFLYRDKLILAPAKSEFTRSMTSDVQAILPSGGELQHRNCQDRRTGSRRITDKHLQFEGRNHYKAPDRFVRSQNDRIGVGR